MRDIPVNWITQEAAKHKMSLGKKTTIAFIAGWLTGYLIKAVFF